MILRRWMHRQIHQSTDQKAGHRQRLVIWALRWRFCYYLLLAISCACIPDHNPGDDVLHFPLRLDNDDAPLFCPTGDKLLDCHGYYNENTNLSSSGMQRHFWKFWLTPLPKREIPNSWMQKTLGLDCRGRRPRRSLSPVGWREMSWSWS